MKPGAWSNGKVIGLAVSLGAMGNAVGLLHCLWRAAEQHDWIAGSVPWRKVVKLHGGLTDPDGALEALVDAEFVTVEPDNGGQIVTVRGWHEHWPSYLRDRWRQYCRRNGLDPSIDPTTIPTRNAPEKPPNCPGQSRTVPDSPGQSDPSASASASAYKEPPKGNARAPERGAPPDQSPGAQVVQRVLNRLEAARTGPPLKEPSRAEIDRAADLLSRQPTERVDAALDAYLADQHESTSARTLANFLRNFDAMAGVAAKRSAPRPNPGKRPPPDAAPCPDGCPHPEGEHGKHPQTGVRYCRLCMCPEHEAARPSLEAAPEEVPAW